MSSMKLEIVTPERKVYDKDIEMVIVKGIEGEIGILPGHIPFVTPLQVGPLKARTESGEDVIAVNGGFMEVRREKVVILAETAERPEEIDLKRAEEAKRRAEERVNKKEDKMDLLRAELALQKAVNRIRVKSRNM